jgi:hypothetical protein
MFFFMKYAGIALGEPLDFFRHYQRPVWSVLYRLACLPGAAAALPVNDQDAAVRAHAMAMLLHSLDDHLVDGQVPVTHLALLARGQAWRMMADSIDRFCHGNPDALDTAGGLIDDYITSVSTPDVPRSLDRYCALFHGQAATGLIIPLLIARKIGVDEQFTSGLRSAYESFGIAWRLLDDIQDLEADLAKGGHGAVYACLDNDGRALWDSMQNVSGPAADQTAEQLFTKIRDASILETIARRMMSELDHAADSAQKIGLSGLAAEYRTLAGPVIKWMGTT